MNDRSLWATTGQQQLPLKGKGAQAERPDFWAIQQAFEAQVEQTPDAIAVCLPASEAGEARRCTYRELNQRANQVAHALRTLGVEPEVIVGLCVERSIEMVVGLLGILKAGGAYLPLDPAYPPERLAFMGQDAQVTVILTEQHLTQRFVESKHTLVVLDRIMPALALASTENPSGQTAPEQAAYLIYTSGSTGAPKGVLVQHRSLTSFCETMASELALTPQDRILQFASLNFDAAVEEIYPCLISGATLVLRTEGMTTSNAHFWQQCQNWGVTVLDLPTAYWHELCATLQPQTASLIVPAALRLLIIGGEKALPAPLQAWQAAVGPRVQLFNTYGPTETTVSATLCDLSLVTVSHLTRMDSQQAGNIAPSEPASVQVPIGSPLRHVQTYLLDEQLRPVAPGMPGELWIGGAGLARGYLNQPGLTAERFVPDPFSHQTGARLYRTGDRARYRPDTQLEFLGRLDDQVKIRGFRIEPGEVEAALLRHPAVREAIVLVREDQQGDKQLIGYVTFNTGQSVAPVELRRYLQQKLPDYMAPAALVAVDALPLTPNGKVDRQALLAMRDVSAWLECAGGEPRNELERWLAELWQAILGIDKLGIYDNFFELGGDSIKGMRLLNRIQEQLRTILHIVALFEAPTIAEQARYFTTHYAEAVAHLFPAESSQVLVQPVARVDAAKIKQLRQWLPTLPALDRAPTPQTPNQPAIFILSPPRSGSTLLRVMLDGHSKLFAPPELALLNFNTLAERQAALAGPNSYLLEGAIRAIVQLKACSVTQAQQIVRELEAQGLTVQQFYRLLQQWLPDQILVDKSTDYALDRAVLNRAELYFTEPLYIHLLRHPYGMIHSFQKVRLDQLFLNPQHPFAPQELAELIWILSHQNILEFLKDVPRHRQYRVKFEELVAQPQRTLEDICQFLNLHFEPAMVQPYQGRQQRMTDGLHAESRMIGDLAFHEHTAIAAEVANEWQKSHTVDFLSDSAWDLAEALGYPRSAAEPEPAYAELPPIRRVDSSTPAQWLARLDQLSPEELTALLDELLAQQEKNAR